MATRIDAALDAIMVALGQLKTAGTIKDVVRRSLSLDEPSLPIVGVLPDSAVRKGGPNDREEWALTVVIHVLTKGQDVKNDEAIADLIAAVQGKLDGIHGANGYQIAEPQWTLTYALRTGWLVPVGATLITRVRFVGKLAV